MLKRWLGTALVLPFLQACSGAGGAVSSSANLSPVEKALRSGDAMQVADSDDLLNAALQNIDESQQLLLADKAFIFNLNNDGSAKSDGSSLTAIDWDPSHDAALFNPTFSRNIPLLLTNAISYGNAAVENQPLAVMGKKNNSRYLALGSNPMRTAEWGLTTNAQMHQFMQNALQWLTGRQDLTSKNFNVVIAQLDQSYYFPDNNATRKWLDT